LAWWDGLPASRLHAGNSSIAFLSDRLALNACAMSKRGDSDASGSLRLQSVVSRHRIREFGVGFILQIRGSGFRSALFRIGIVVRTRAGRPTA
jgi:hypothetical protein